MGADLQVEVVTIGNSTEIKAFSSDREKTVFSAEISIFYNPMKSSSNTCSNVKGQVMG